MAPIDKPILPYSTDDRHTVYLSAENMTYVYTYAFIQRDLQRGTYDSSISQQPNGYKTGQK